MEEGERDWSERRNPKNIQERPGLFSVLCKMTCKPSHEFTLIESWGSKRIQFTVWEGLEMKEFVVQKDNDVSLHIHLFSKAEFLHLFGWVWSLASFFYFPCLSEILMGLSFKYICITLSTTLPRFRQRSLTAMCGPIKVILYSEKGRGEERKPTHSKVSALWTQVQCRIFPDHSFSSHPHWSL